MDSRERILTTMDHEEPDRVPIFCFSIESLDVVRGYGFSKPASMYDLNPRKSFEIFKKIGTDLVIVPTSSLPVAFETATGKSVCGIPIPEHVNMVDEFGRTFSYYNQGGIHLTNYVGGVFSSDTGDVDEIISKYEKWSPPDPSEKDRYQYYKGVLRKAKGGGPYVIPFAQSFFENAWQPFGFQNFTKLLFKRPDFIKDVLKTIEEFLKGVIDYLVTNFSIELFFFSDDLGYKTGPLISPRHFIQFIFPKMKDFVSYCHKNSVKAMFHSCGNINKLLDKVIETKIDGLNPLEPSASMDIFEIKRKYGKKITLMGNVDTINLLSKGTPKDIELYVRKLIQHCAPGGGFILADSHSINPQITHINYKTLITSTKKYGIYPISNPLP